MSQIMFIADPNRMYSARNLLKDTEDAGMRESLMLPVGQLKYRGLNCLSYLLFIFPFLLFKK